MIDYIIKIKQLVKIIDNCGREKLLGQHPLCEQAIDSTPSAKAKSVQLKIIQKDFCYTRYTRCTSWFSPN